MFNPPAVIVASSNVAVLGPVSVNVTAPAEESPPADSITLPASVIDSDFVGPRLESRSFSCAIIVDPGPYPVRSSVKVEELSSHVIVFVTPFAAICTEPPSTMLAGATASCETVR